MLSWPLFRSSLDVYKRQVPSIAITSEEAVDMVQETAKLLVKDIKDSLLVPVTRNRDSREVRCLYTDVFLREVSLTETPKKLSQSM